jgi:Mrp family chromosome partitioning ATPase
MFDALKHTDGNTTSASATRAEAGKEPVLSASTELSNDIPYVEVGGGAIELGGTGLATRKTPLADGLTSKKGPQPTTSPSIRASIHSTGKWQAPVETSAESEARSIAFQPLPAVQLPARTARRRFAAELITFHDPEHPVSTQYRSLLSGLTAQLPLGGPQVLLIAAAYSTAGATTVLLNLAITRAQQGNSRVAVVDANLRQPAIAERLGIAAGPGLRDVLTGRFPWQRALKESGQPHLLALTAGEPVGASAWPPAESIRNVLQQLRKHFDMVLVDAPAWDGGPEMAALGSACDAVYLVLRPAETESARVAELTQLVPHLGGHLGGYIITHR